MRHLATIREIKEILPIPEADAIELAIVDNWKVVVKKGEFKNGDIAVYCEIDSFLPVIPEFEFLRKSSYKKLADGSEGFRLKTIKLRGQISQGLLINTDIAYKIYKRNTPNLQMAWFDGLDVTEMLGITKYEPAIPAILSGDAKGLFPGFIQKTDEERIQNFKNREYEEMKKYKYYATEKIDGTSVTYFVRNGEFGVCSRNIELKEDDDNTYCKMAKELNIKEKLLNLRRNIAIQGEIIGEGIQKNPYKLKGQQFRVFNTFNIDEFEYYSKEETELFCEFLNLETVPVLSRSYTLPETVSELLENVNGKSVLNGLTSREGIVFVSINSLKRISFKAISNQYLLKND